MTQRSFRNVATGLVFAVTLAACSASVPPSPTTDALTQPTSDTPPVSAPATPEQAKVVHPGVIVVNPGFVVDGASLVTCPGSDTSDFSVVMEATSDLPYPEVLFPATLRGYDADGGLLFTSTEIAPTPQLAYEGTRLTLWDQGDYSDTPSFEIEFPDVPYDPDTWYWPVVDGVDADPYTATVDSDGDTNITFEVTNNNTYPVYSVGAVVTVNDLDDNLVMVTNAHAVPYGDSDVVRAGETVAFTARVCGWSNQLGSVDINVLAFSSQLGS